MNSSARRTLALTVAAATATAGTLVWAPAAQAKGTITDYGLSGRAYGTQVGVGGAGVKSDRTAEAHVSCTRRTGIRRTNGVAGIEESSLDIEGVANRTRTYKTKKRFGTKSTARLAKVRLGDQDVNITIEGLTTHADAFAVRRSGKLGATSRFTSTDISAKTGTPLDDVLNPVGAGIGDLLGEISEAPNNELRIEGLGVLSLGGKNNKVKPRKAIAQASSLRLALFGPDGTSGTGDDVRAVIGKARATIHRDVTAGIFRGKAVPIEGRLVGGRATIGRLVNHPLPCPGTDGKVRKQSSAGVDLLELDEVNVGAVNGKVYGVAGRRGSAKGWTESSVAEINLGNQLVVKGVVGRALVKMSRSGKVVKRSTAGSQIASITFGTDSVDIPGPGEVELIPGVAKLQSFVKKRSKRGISVVALRVTLLEASGETESVIDLGAAKTYITRS